MAKPTDSPNRVAPGDTRKQADTAIETRPSADNNRLERHALTPSNSGDERHRLIAEAAYRMAEMRGFAGGYDLQDWFAAEREVDEMLEATRRTADADRPK